METLGEIADESPPKRPRYDKEDEELLEKINSEEVTEMTFRDCLTQHVEQVRRKQHSNMTISQSKMYHIVSFVLYSTTMSIVLHLSMTSSDLLPQS
jgi:hypothetical protein